MTTRWRKKPVEIEAIRTGLALSYAQSSWRDLPEWLRATYEAGDVIFASLATYDPVTE